MSDIAYQSSTSPSYEDPSKIPTSSTSRQPKSPYTRFHQDKIRQGQIVFSHSTSDFIRKKPGRKKDFSEPTSKRLAQNRAAQRAFRERKENYVKTLEKKIKELELQQDEARKENELLRLEIHNLKQTYNVNQSYTAPAPVAAHVLYSTPPNDHPSHSQGYPPQSSNQKADPYVSYNITPSVTRAPRPSSFYENPPNTQAFNQENYSQVSYNPGTPAEVYKSTPNLPKKQFSTADDYLFPEFSQSPSTNYVSEQEASTNLPKIHILEDVYHYPPGYHSSINHRTDTYPSYQVQTEEYSYSTSDPTEIMNPSRPPPTHEELLRLANYHKNLVAKIKDQVFTIDNLCDAMRQKANCAAIRDYLVKHLGGNSLDFA
ncbi:DNA-binding transcription factor yap1 [Entomophthora muscae]|uniref:DNA-binding transcription factor yap1 n=1 Tax=Entomophthora muscae TaxID=34485 RepID=A0ACC2UCI3_9FUNG|nr:DNA-binding transcription factor yap1 [Entomophthora muscae]